MAEYVLLGSSEQNNRIRTIVHSDVPVGNNAAGTAWSTALVEFLGDTASQVPPSVLPVGRQAELDSGAKYEWQLQVEVDANATNPAKLAVIEAAINAAETAEIDRLANKLRFWGETGVS